MPLSSGAACMSLLSALGAVRRPPTDGRMSTPRAGRRHRGRAPGPSAPEGPVVRVPVSAAHPVTGTSPGSPRGLEDTGWTLSSPLPLGKGRARLRAGPRQLRGVPTLQSVWLSRGWSGRPRLPEGSPDDHTQSPICVPSRRPAGGDRGELPPDGGQLRGRAAEAGRRSVLAVASGGGGGVRVVPLPPQPLLLCVWRRLVHSTGGGRRPRLPTPL